MAINKGISLLNENHSKIMHSNVHTWMKPNMNL